MAKTFMQMATEAQSKVSAVAPAEVQRRLKENQPVLLIDVRDTDVIRATGKVPGAVPISAGSLLYKADLEVPEDWRDARVQDRARPVITLCDLGPLSAISAAHLKDMGFLDVGFVEGGLADWKQVGLPTEPFAG